MLEMRSKCEVCSQALGHQDQAYICSYECTFCPDCTAKMKQICPNCGGHLVTRPIRRSR